MEKKYHIAGIEQFGYSMVNRYLYSFYVYMNSVKKICELYPYASVQYIKGYAAHFCYIRLKSFDTFLKVAVEHKDYVTANCIMRMLGDSVAVFHLIYMEPNEDWRILRHSLYVIDGCERNLEVLPENSIKEGSLPEDERKRANEEIRYNIEHRERLMREAQELLDQSPLKKLDEVAFECIVNNRNWKFKDFKAYKKGNKYQWRELYEKIDFCDGYDLLSYVSQFAHGLSMSNLVINSNDNNFDSVIGEALGLLDRMNQYVLDFYNKDIIYIGMGLLEPEMRDKILACYDDRHRPTNAEWERNLFGIGKTYKGS